MTAFFIAIVFIILFFLVVMAVDGSRFVIREYTCRSKKLGKEGKFLLLSDLHNKSFGSRNEKLLKAIEKEEPDVILIAGDMYTCSKKEDNRETAEFVSALARKYPVYYGNGNHEHKTRISPETYGTMYEDYMKQVRKAGAVTLVNQKVSLPAYNMEIYGFEPDRQYYGKFVDKQMNVSYPKKLLGKPDAGCFNLLIAHNPDYFETYADWGADLTVSGHVHGGIMRLPVLGGVISPKLTLFPKYDGGRYEKDGKEMILSRGLGSHTLPVRIFNPGELVVIHMKRE